MIQFLVIFEFWFSIEMSSPADDQANWFSVNNICITDIKNSTYINKSKGLKFLQTAIINTILGISKVIIEILF